MLSPAKHRVNSYYVTSNYVLEDGLFERQRRHQRWRHKVVSVPLISPWKSTWSSQQASNELVSGVTDWVDFSFSTSLSFFFLFSYSSYFISRIVLAGNVKKTIRDQGNWLIRMSLMPLVVRKTIKNWINNGWMIAWQKKTGLVKVQPSSRIPSLLIGKGMGLLSYCEDLSDYCSCLDK